MFIVKSFLIFLLLQICASFRIRCGFDSLAICFKNTVDNYGSINIVFAYKFLQGYSSDPATSNPFKLLSDIGASFEKPILFIEPYRTMIKKFEFKIPVGDSYQPVWMKNYTQIEMETNEEIYENEKCSIGLETVVWQISRKNYKFCNLFYACHVSRSKEGYITFKRLIFVTDDSQNPNEVKNLVLNESEYEKESSSFDDFRGERFCMCENIILDVPRKHYEVFDASSDDSAFGWGLILFAFILIFSILYLIYSCLMEDNSEKKKSIKNQVRMVNARNRNYLKRQKRLCTNIISVERKF